MIRLYAWRSKALQNYSSGLIIAAGYSVRSARTSILAEINALAKRYETAEGREHVRNLHEKNPEQNDYSLISRLRPGFTAIDFDEYDQEQFDMFVMQLKQDVAEKPQTLGLTAFI